MEDGAISLTEQDCVQRERYLRLSALVLAIG